MNDVSLLITLSVLIEAKHLFPAGIDSPQNGFNTAIKAQRGSSLILFPTCSCLFCSQFGEMTRADVASEFSRIFQGLFLLVLLIDWTIANFLLVHISSVTCRFAPCCLFRCSHQ